MIRVLALTQFAFLTLGIVALKILVHANTATSAYYQSLNRWSLWLFAVPLVWVGFASICVAYGKTILPRVAQITGVLLAILCFLFLATVTFLT